MLWVINSLNALTEYIEGNKDQEYAIEETRNNLKSLEPARRLDTLTLALAFTSESSNVYQVLRNDKGSNLPLGVESLPYPALHFFVLRRDGISRSLGTSPCLHVTTWPVRLWAANKHWHS